MPENLSETFYVYLHRHSVTTSPGNLATLSPCFCQGKSVLLFIKVITRIKVPVPVTESENPWFKVMILGAGGLAQVVESMLSKHKTLNSNSSTTKRQKSYDFFHLLYLAEAFFDYWLLISSSE
jgi:hypothetical protein